MKPNCLDDYVFVCMRNGKWWTFWELQQVIKEKTGKFYGEPTISAAIRNLRKDYARVKYNLSQCDEVVEKKRLWNSNGWKYRLIIKE
jgi:hypothetical protein|tara:strand:+ start:415 stop:675 length:261 start_codon:yes stop_codon:yes gene_type:complete